MIYAATGHRPDKLGGYSPAVRERLRGLALRFLTARRHLVVEGISGMALGWDEAWAEALLLQGVPLHAAVPCDGQERLWPLEAQVRYRSLLRRAARVTVVSPGPYAASKMLRRDEWMVRNCTRVAALYNGGAAGGTAHTVRYALARGVPVDNLWDEWKKEV